VEPVDQEAVNATSINAFKSKLDGSGYKYG